MKTQTIRRLLLTVAAGAMLVGPLSTLSATAQEGRHDDRPKQAQDNDRHDNYERHGNKRWRDDRRDARWDDSQHNGYYERSRWHAGPPPPTAYGRPGFQLGYQPWQRGQHLGYYNTRYVEVDYRREHLRAPQRGYHWVRDDRGDYLLAAIASGLIASVIIGASH